MEYAIIFTSGYRPLADHFEGLLCAVKKDNNYKFSHFKLFHKSIGISYENWIKSYRA